MVKRIALTILILALLLPCIACPRTAEAKYSGGSGDPNDPYQIADSNDWQQLMNTSSDWGKCFIMEEDINLAGVSLTPIENFTGVFDGNNHIISNIDINLPSANFAGLFIGIGNGGWIRNLGVENATVDGNNSAGALVIVNDSSINNHHLDVWVDYAVGALAAMNHGNISNCHSSGNVSGYSSVGVLVGFNHGYILNSYSTGQVSGSQNIGGLVGYNEGGVVWGFSWGGIRKCYSSVHVIGPFQSEYVGGLVGFNNGNVNNCYSTGTVSGYQEIGGLVGENDYYIDNCYSTGAVSGYSSVGGLSGKNWGRDGDISNCYSTGQVYGNGYVGGLAGKNEEGDISNCYSTGQVYGNGLFGGNGYVGGLVGFNFYNNIRPYPNGTITNCYSIGKVSSSPGVNYVGGLVGFNKLGSISGSFWDIQTSEQTTSAGGTGETTAEMMKKSTFTDADWDFAGLWSICETTNYPRFLWQISSGDVTCPDGVDIFDLAVLSDEWLPPTLIFNQAPPGGDGIVNFLDFAVFANNWDSNPDIETLDAFADEWLEGAFRADLWPSPKGDGIVNFADFAVLANHWLEGF